MLQDQVDGCRVEGRGDDQATDLGDEAAVGKGVAAHNQPAGVANCFRKTPQADCNHIRPCPVSNPQPNAGDRENRKYRQQSRIGRETRLIAVYGDFESANVGELGAECPLRHVEIL